MQNTGTYWTIKHPNVIQCLKDYSIEIFFCGAWQTVAEVKNNLMRKRIHNFPKCVAEKLRVTVLETNGDPSARIIELRAALEN